MIKPRVSQKLFKALASEGQAALETSGDGFPNTWADKFQTDFDISRYANLEDLERARLSKKNDALLIATKISQAVLERGLPFSIDDAHNLPERYIFYVEKLVRPNANSTDVIYDYFDAVYPWIQAEFHYHLPSVFNSQLGGVIINLRSGVIIGDNHLYQEWTKLFGDFRRDLKSLEHGTGSVVGPWVELVLFRSRGT
jgi:hypothetical protein